MLKSDIIPDEAVFVVLLAKDGQETVVGRCCLVPNIVNSGQDQGRSAYPCVSTGMLGDAIGLGLSNTTDYISVLATAKSVGWCV